MSNLNFQRYSDKQKAKYKIVLMGILRSEPLRSQICFVQDLSEYYCVTASVCGWQIFMSNFYFSFHYSQHVHVIGILQGQAGPEIAQFCSSQIQHIISKCDLMKLQQYQAAIQNLCVTLDFLIKQNRSKINKIRIKYNLPELPQTQEYPASASLIICIVDRQSITVGNLGQCKSYVSYKNSPQTFVLISGTHVIESDLDSDAINKRGGFVTDDLINGKFLHSKSIGNLKYKNLNDQSKSVIGCEPSVFTLRRQDLSAIVMGSSGLWEGPETVLKRIFENKLNPLQQKQNIGSIIQDLIAQSHEEQFGKQNMTVQALFIDY